MRWLNNNCAVIYDSRDPNGNMYLYTFLTNTAGTSSSISNAYTATYSQTVNIVTNNTGIYAKPQYQGVLVGEISTGTAVKISGYEMFRGI